MLALKWCLLDFFWGGESKLAKHECKGSCPLGPSWLRAWYCKCTAECGSERLENQFAIWISYDTIAVYFHLNLARCSPIMNRICGPAYLVVLLQVGSIFLSTRSSSSLSIWQFVSESTCRRTCSARWSDRENEREHWWQGNGRTPVCLR